MTPANYFHCLIHVKPEVRIWTRKAGRIRQGYRCRQVRLAGLVVFAFAAGLASALPQAVEFQILHAFPGCPSTPEAPLVQAADGGFYGTTRNGGTHRLGTIFRLTAGGTESTLAEFSGTNGANPWAGLIQANDGCLYGTTYAGGPWNKGTVFKITTDGILSTLASFAGTNGANPYASLVQASDGNFYGTTYYGGSIGDGTVFRITPRGTLTTLCSFDPSTAIGGYPYAGLVEGTDGNLYGANSFGGTTNCVGSIFKISLAGSASTFFSFDGTSNGGFPRSTLVQGRDGYLYGSTSWKGIFKLSLDGKFTPLAAFTNSMQISPLVQATNGRFYGTTYSGGDSDKGSVFEMTPAGGLTTLVSFAVTNGANPYAGLSQGSDGVLYGTTEGGGLDGNGTLFKISTNGALTTLYAFYDPDGGYPEGTLTEGSDGNFYGTTASGGSHGHGTLFRITPAGQFTRLADFDGNTIDSPSAIVQGKDGSFYGVSPSGGSHGSGEFFRATIDGTLTPLLSFDTPTTGGWPSGLAVCEDGSFYGTSAYSTNRWGGVFRVTTNGILTNLGSLSDGESGGGPGGLVEGTNGDFYGLFPGMDGDGTVFKVQPDGEVPIVFNFNRYQGNSGADPSSLLLGTDGNFYGTTTSYSGAFFRMTPDGILTQLFQFNTVVGTGPRLLARGGDGNFYGVTSDYGAYGRGSLFRITPAGVPTVLLSFSAADALPAPQSLLLGTDGSFYGTTYSGSAFEGSVFRLVLVPKFVSLTRRPGGISLASSGPANSPLRLWSASDITLPMTQWTLMVSNSFDAQGAFSFTDFGVATNRARFYRISLP
jgi:uncharacterized repeat protein (TIGR03803 family)